MKEAPVATLLGVVIAALTFGLFWSYLLRHPADNYRWFRFLTGVFAFSIIAAALVLWLTKGALAFFLVMSIGGG